MQLRRRLTTCIHNICGEEGYGQWTRPTQEEYKLYQSDYRHKHHPPGACTICAACLHDEDEVCSDALSLPCSQLGCDEHRLVLRKHRNMANPEVHFGLMGSGDVVMISTTHRNIIAQEENLLGFEMEAAGMWDSFPTVVAKAVCDYADSHKNRRWQKYASVVAASCMKALLQEWRPTSRRLASSGNEEEQQASQHGGRITNQGGVTFSNQGRVGNQAVNQIFGGPVNFSYSRNQYHDGLTKYDHVKSVNLVLSGAPDHELGNKRV